MIKKGVCIYGDATIDFRTQIPGDLQFNKDGLFLSPIEVRPAGDAGTVAQQLALLEQKVVFIGTIGKDIYGEIIINRFRNIGIDIRYVKRVRGETGKNIILLYSNKRRAIISHLGVHTRINNLKILTNYDFIYIPSFPCYYPLFKKIQAVRKFNSGRSMGKIITDLGLHSKIKEISCVIRNIGNIEICCVSGEHFNGREQKEIGNLLLKSKVAIGLITLGRGGVYMVTRDEKKFFPAFRVSHILDTCGIGNSFLAGFLAKATEDTDLERAVIYGQATAVLRLQKINKLPTKKEVDEFLSKHFS